jgi:AcrR family transcriptional regulator
MHNGPVGISAEPLPAQTRERVLDAAEQLFAEKGLHGVSTREITRQAGANISAINYYFGGKEGLVLAVLTRRLQPIQQRRIAALDAVEKTAATGRPKLEDILEALIRPLVEDAFQEAPGHTHFARLMGRVLGETGETVERLRRAHFVPLFQRFEAALRQALPRVSEEELFWRMIFIFGALHFMMLAVAQPLPEWPDYKPEAERQIRRMIAFAAAGLRVEGLSLLPPF